MTLELLLLLLLAITCAGFVVLFRKVRRIDISTWDLRQSISAELASTATSVQDNLYRQLESLQALHGLLKLPRPLPSLRGWAGSPDFLLELAREMLLHRPATVVECSSGASTVVAARCCQMNGTGHVFSLENSPEYAQKTRRLLADSGLQDWATVIDAPLQQVELGAERYSWYTLDGLEARSIDLLVVDGPPAGLREQARYPAGPLLVPRLSADGAVMLDDADRPDEKRIIERWRAEFGDLMAESRSAEKGLVVLSRAQALPGA